VHVGKGPRGGGARWGVGWALVWAAASAWGGPKPPQYTWVDIGGPSGDPAEMVYARSAAAFNNRGQIIGDALLRTEWPYKTNNFLWDKGIITVLPEVTPPGMGSIVRAISENGRILGTVGFGSSSKAALLVQDGWELLPTPPEVYSSTGNALNNRETVCGQVTIYRDGQWTWNRPVVWHKGEMEALALPQDPAVVGGYAYAVNDSDVVVGAVVVQVWDPKWGYWMQQNRAAIWDGRGLTLVHPAGALASMFQDVSNTGEAVGQVTLPDYKTLPVAWTRQGGLKPLPVPPDMFGGSAIAVNEAGQVLGTLSVPVGRRPVLWWQGQMFDLTQCVVGGLPSWYQVMGSVAINARGQIVLQVVDMRFMWAPRVVLLDPTGK